MYDRRQQIMGKIQTLPKGSVSASGRYWCVTCKKLFRMEQPVCPYMTAMCVNSPIALEKFAPESAEWLEKMGLFYPKIPQMVMAALLKENPIPIGKRLAETYLEFLAEWKIEFAPSAPSNFEKLRFGFQRLRDGPAHPRERDPFYRDRYAQNMGGRHSVFNFEGRRG